MSSTSVTRNDEKRCGNCNKLLVKDGKLKCTRCGEECPVHPELDDSKPGTLASARRVFMTNWDCLLINDTRVHLKRCELARFEHRMRDLVAAGTRVWQSETYVNQYTDLIYDFMMMVDGLERTRDQYMATSGILEERCFQLVQQPDVYEEPLRSQVADCIRIRREGTPHCAGVSQRVRELKEELSQLRNLWRQNRYNPTKSQRHQELEDRDFRRRGWPLDTSEQEELKALHDAHFLTFRRNVGRAYLESKFAFTSASV